MLPATIQTPRLLLRPHRFDDLADNLAYASDPDWGRFLPVPTPYTRRDAEEFIARQILMDRKERFSWALEFEGKANGGFSIRFYGENRIAVIGYSLARPLWGRGLMTEAVRAVIDAAFRAVPELRRIRARADVRNLASIRVMEKAGMAREATLRANAWFKGELHDEAMCGILREEWEKGRD